MREILPLSFRVGVCLVACVGCGSTSSTPPRRGIEDESVGGSKQTGSAGSPTTDGGANMAGLGGATSGSAGGSSAGTAGGGPIEPIEGFDLGSITVERIAQWKWDAMAAYTITHDDLCDAGTEGQFKYAEGELNSRGLRAAFGAIVGSCKQRNLWPQVNQLLAAGHEIMSHGWGHKNLVTETRDFSLEVNQAKAELDAQLSRPTLFFIFPYDEFDAAAVQAVKDAGHLGARAGKRGLNSPSVNEFAIGWDTYGPAYSIYKSDPVKSKDILSALLDDAVANGMWAVRELHGVEDKSWEPVPLADYRAHLDKVKQLVEAGTVWMDVPTAIIKYRKAATVCGVPNASLGTLRFSAPDATCATYSVPVSVILDTEVDADSLNAVQMGVKLESKKLGPKRFIVNVDPARGDAQLRGL